MTGKPRAVIVGAGFAGLWAARALAKADFDVVIVDRNNYHTFLPLLYQVAAAELEPEQIAYPVRGIFRGSPGISFTMAEVLGVDFEAKRLVTDGGDIAYDYLLLAAGSVTRYFRIPGAAEHCFSLKTLEEAIFLRNHILTLFERSMAEPDVAVRERQRTFVVVGGGPTGVEYAGALAELIRGPLARDYDCQGLCQSRIILLEATGAILSPFPDALRRYAIGRLGHMGVEVRLGAKVKEVGPDVVRLDGGEAIRSETVVWTAGVKGVPQAASWGLETTRDGRIQALPTLQIPNRPEAFVAGDLCGLPGAPLPMIAPVAIQEGKAAAQNIVRLSRGELPRDFAYRDKGTMATIGRGAAVVVLASRGFTGHIAWLLWLFVHLLYLVGFRNRLIVLITWTVDYFMFERSVRLILPRDPLLTRSPPPGAQSQAKTVDRGNRPE